MRRAQLWAAGLQIRDGVEAETRHFNTVLRAEAVWMGTHHALATLDEMIEGQMGRHIRPDIGSYNAIIEACLPTLCPATPKSPNRPTDKPLVEPSELHVVQIFVKRWSESGSSCRVPAPVA